MRKMAILRSASLSSPRFFRVNELSTNIPRHTRKIYKNIKNLIPPFRPEQKQVDVILDRASKVVTILGVLVIFGGVYEIISSQSNENNKKFEEENQKLNLKIDKLHPVFNQHRWVNTAFYPNSVSYDIKQRKSDYLEFKFMLDVLYNLRSYISRSITRYILPCLTNPLLTKVDDNINMIKMLEALSDAAYLFDRSRLGSSRNLNIDSISDITSILDNKNNFECETLDLAYDRLSNSTFIKNVNISKPKFAIRYEPPTELEIQTQNGVEKIDALSSKHIVYSYIYNLLAIITRKRLKLHSHSISDQEKDNLDAKLLEYIKLAIQHNPENGIICCNCAYVYNYIGNRFFVKVSRNSGNDKNDIDKTKKHYEIAEKMYTAAVKLGGNDYLTKSGLEYVKMCQYRLELLLDANKCIELDLDSLKKNMIKLQDDLALYEENIHQKKYLPLFIGDNYLAVARTLKHHINNNKDDNNNKILRNKVNALLDDAETMVIEYLQYNKNYVNAWQILDDIYTQRGDVDKNSKLNTVFNKIKNERMDSHSTCSIL